MKKLLIILLSALSLMAFAQKPKIAVYMTGDDPINEIVSNRLVDDFARGNEYTTVERTASFLAELSKEHNYERSGEVDDEQIAALGRQFNVQYVCVTSVLNVWGEEKYITARIIDTETAEVVASCSSNGSIQNSSELISALNNLSDNFFNAMRSTKQNDAKKVAVYVTKTGNRDVDVVLGDQLVAGFAKSGRYVAIERTSGFLKKLKEEQGYQQSGAVADDDLTRWGQQFGVQYICVTKTTSWAGDYFITTRMVDVKTGEVVNSFKVEGRKLSNSTDVVRTAREIATELSKGTFAEQAEEIRLREEVRLRAEQEERARFEAEEQVRKKAEEEELRRKNAYEEECRRLMQQTGYVDLGLPSGTKWNSQHQSDKYSFDRALNVFGNSLPSYQQVEELFKNCAWERYGNGYIVTGANGNKIYFHDAADFIGQSSFWTRTPKDKYDAFYFYIKDGEWGIRSGKTYEYMFSQKNGRDQQLHVRLVR